MRQRWTAPPLLSMCLWQTSSQTRAGCVPLRWIALGRRRKFRRARQSFPCRAKCSTPALIQALQGFGWPAWMTMPSPWCIASWRKNCAGGMAISLRRAAWRRWLRRAETPARFNQRYLRGFRALKRWPGRAQAAGHPSRRPHPCCASGNCHRRAQQARACEAAHQPEA